MLAVFKRHTPLAALLLAAAACGDAPAPSDAGADAGPGDAGPTDAGPDVIPTGCMTAFAGDETKEPEITLTVLGAGSAVSPLEEGGVAPLIFPPQGGRVIFAGARVKNIDPCGVTLTGALRDLTTKQVRVDGRTVNLLLASDGVAETDPTDYSSFSNIPVCPNQWSETNLFGSEYELELTVVDRAGRTAQKKVRVTPECVEPDRLQECLCICKADYVLGETCGDAGAGDAGSDAGGGE